MNYRGSPPTRQRVMLDKRRKQSRRQYLRLAVLAALLLIVLGLFLGAINLVKATFGRPVSGARQAITVSHAKPRAKPQLALERSFKPAPWFIAVDSNRLYVGQDSARQNLDSGGYPLDTIEAYSLGDKKLAWTCKLGSQFSNVALAGNMLITFSENLGEFTGFEIHAYDVATGVSAWTARSDEGDDAQIACDSNVVTVGYKVLPASEKDAGYRLKGYQATTGKEVWHQSPKMYRLRRPELEGMSVTAGLKLEGYEGLVVYQAYNVVGVISTVIRPRSNTAPVLSEFAAEGQVLDVQLDTATRTAYALCASSKPGTCFIETMPLGKEAPFSLCRISSETGEAIILADRGYLLVAYTAAGLEGITTTKLLAFKPRVKKPFTYKFEAGRPAALAALPETPGEFLLALNEGQTPDGRLAGPSSLRRITLAAKPSVWETARQKSAVLMLAPFKLDCIALLAGGETRLYNLADDNAQRLRRAPYPELGAVYSANHASLAITGYPPEYVQGKPGLPMQVTVWH